MVLSSLGVEDEIKLNKRSGDVEDSVQIDLVAAPVFEVEWI